MANKKFTLQFDFEGNIGPIKTAVDGLKKSLLNIKIPDNIGTSLEKTLGRLTSELQVFEAATKDSFHDLSDIKAAEKSFNKIVTLLNQLNIQSKSVTGLDPKKFLPQETIDRVKKLEKNWESLQKEVGKQDQITKQIEQQTKAIKEQEAALKELEAKREVLTDDIKGQKAQRKKLVQSRDADTQSRNEIVAKMTELEGQKGGKTSAEYKLLNQELTRLGQAIKNADKEIDTLSASIDRNATQQRKLKAQIEQANESFEKQKTELQNLQNLSLAPKGLTELRAELAELKEVKIDEIPTDLKELQTVINSLTEEELEEIAVSLTKIKNAADDLPGSVVKGREALEGMRDAGEGLQRTADEISNIKRRVLEFFSITNSIQLFKRAVQEAFNTVKELDAVMTETAVVTDFTVGDMWDKLPVYSKQATALGASIKDLYSATTLYYQQGLETNAAMGVGVETMKMARIANMDAADATQAMTAALRGFNMEVNEMNAQKVNDVYSELAAITAADTSQIATAMSKTASIAASANMEFETTAALLSQIIETTQEAPETAGTAMKTIIARFTEVKQLFDEGQLKGQDTEGEEIDINKIDGALKSVGISLKDFLNGTKGIDDIFLELASKWDTLDLATQRYIATMAAGSRQQSRFIAMMSNYDRTMELVTAANNSAGASQEQFDKTLESLDAKLQKLSNAWDEFVMGLANNEIIKLGVDLLTGLLETINNITSALSGGSGLVKSVVSLLTVVGALKGGKSLFDNLFGGKQLAEIDFGNGQKGVLKIGKDIKNQAETEGQELGKKVISGFQRSMEQGRAHGITAGLKSFFGEVSTSYEEQVQQIDPKKVLSSRIGEELESAKVGQGNFIEDKQGVDLTNTINQLSELENGLNNGSISMEEAQKQAKALGVDISNLDNNFEAVQKPIENFSLNLQNVGVAAMGVGTAFSLLSGLAEKLNAEGLAEVLKTIGTILTTTGSAITALSPILDKLGVSFGSFGMMIKGKVVMSLGALLPMIGGVAVALTALVGVFILIRNASPEYQLKQAAEAANQTAEAADAAAEAYDNLKLSLESIEGKEAVLEDLAVGTLEWKKAVSELNNEILDLVAKYPELSKFVTSTNGILSISDEGDQKLLENQLAVQQSAQAAKIGSQIRVQEAQQNVDFADLDYRLKLTKTIDTYDSYGNQIQQEVVDRQATEDLAIRLARGEISTDSIELDFLKDIEGGFEEFLEFGRALVASEEAIGVFTQSLMDAAIANAEIPQELKNQVQGAFDSEAVSNVMEESKIIGALTKADKEEYAKAMGYTHVSGKKYLDSQGNDIKISNAAVKQQLAAIRAQESLIGKFETLEGVLKKLSSSTNAIDKAFINVTTKAGGAALTLEDLSSKEIGDAFAKDYEGSIQTDEYGEFKDFENQHLQSLYEQVKDSYSPEDFFRIFSDAYGQATDRMVQANEKLSRIGLGDSFKNAKIDTGAFYDLTDNLYDVFIASGQKKTTELSSMLESIFGKIKDPEQAQIFADAINSIDWTDVDSVRGLSDILEGMGFNVPIGDIEKVEDEIINTAKAAKNFSLEEVRNQLKSLGDLKKDLEGRDETERSFTTEQRDAYVEMNAELAEEFVMVGPDEWIYIGDSMNSLEAAIRENTNAVLGENTEILQGKAETSQKWMDLMGSEETYDTSKISTRMVGSQKVTTAADFSGTMNEIVSGILAGEIKDVGIIREILGMLGEEIDGGLSVLVDRLSQSFNKNYGLNGSTANENIAQYQDWKNTEEQQKYISMSGQELVDIVNTGTPEQIEMANKALAAQAKQLNITSEEIEYYKKLLAETGEVTGDLDAAATEMATRIRKQQIAINEASEKIGGYLTTMDKAEEGSNEYLAAILKIPDQIEKAFGFKPDMTWVQDNLDLIRQWAAGSEEAGTQIYNSLYNNIAAAMRGTEAEVSSAIQNMLSFLAQFDGASAWASVYLDDQGFMNTIARTSEAAHGLANYLETLKYDVHFEPVTKWLRVPKITYNSDGDEVGRIYTSADFEEYPVTTYNIKWKPTDQTGSGFDAPNNYTPPSGGGGGGGGGSSTEWKNPYDEFYNTVQKLNEELRKRNKLEKEYQKLLDKINTSANDLTENSKKQLESLEVEKKTREGLLENRKKQMEDIESENSEYSEYAWYNEELGVIEIDWGKIEELDGSTDEEFTQGLEDFISQLEDQEKLIEEEIDALDDIYDETKKIREQGEEEYFSFEDRIKETLLDIRQDEIDKLNAINDSINDTNARLINAMQSSIDKYRQDRDNKKTEEDLADKQRRLAYLQQDTSGANALEIMQLQKEIEEGQEDYTDTLIDQKISELQEQNDKAAEQRERQIQIMEEQLKHYEESGEIWNDVYALMNEGVDSLGNLIEGSELEALLKTSEGFLGMSELEKVKWLEDLENEVAEGFKWLRVGNSMKSLLDSGALNKGQSVTFTTKDGKVVTGTLNDDGSVTTSDGKTYKNVYRSYDGTYKTTENYQTPEPPRQEPPKEETPVPEAPKLTEDIKKGVSAAIWNGGYGWGYDPEREERLKEVFGENDIQKNYVNKSVMSGYSGNLSDYSYSNMKKKFKQYKTGGLADFTGPAWLDGTKSKPEYILNADQTKAFFNLVDVLEGLSSGKVQNTQNTGDSIYDIDINVESIGNDYDVEQMASTIKRMINDDARYRNNNAINLQR